MPRSVRALRRTITAMNNLTNSYSDLGDYQNALNLSEKVLELRKNILGEEHPDTIATNEIIDHLHRLLGTPQNE